MADLMFFKKYPKLKFGHPFFAGAEYLFCELFLVERTVICAGTIILAFAVHTECVPCGGTENILLGNIVHGNGYAEH